MEFTKRSEAIKAGALTYTTGTPCKNGHLTYRYTKSAVCAGCVAASNKGDRAVIVLPVAASARQERKNLFAKLIEMQYRAYPADLPALQDAAAGLLMLRYPTLVPTDACVGLKPTGQAGATFLYRLRTHPEDVASLREYSNILLRAHNDTAAITRARLAIHGRAAELMDAEACPAPEFKP